MYAGDLNAIQDQYADKANFAQTVDLATLRIGETGLQLLRFGSGEARISGALRTDGIIRGLGGLYAGAYTQTQRDAIASGFRPTGLIILNTTSGLLETNKGTDATPNWQPVGNTAQQVAASITQSGTLALRPTPSAMGVGFYLATDQNVLYYSNGSAWSRIGSRPGDLAFTMNNTAEIGRVLCQGQAVSRTGIFADLFAQWGVSFGSGDGSTTFTLPDLRGRALYALASGGQTEVAAIGSNDGVAVASRSPKHKHTVNVPTGAQLGQNFTGASAGSASQPNSPAGNVTVGPQSSAMVDTPSYFTANIEAKL